MVRTAFAEKLETTLSAHARPDTKEYRRIADPSVFPIQNVLRLRPAPIWDAEIHVQAHVARTHSVELSTTTHNVYALRVTPETH